LNRFIEEHHDFKLASRKQQESQNRRGPVNPDVMSYWGEDFLPFPPRIMRPFLFFASNAYLGYKFETLSTLPRPWGETSREYIEGRPGEVVSNKAQYCSVVRTGIGENIMCLGGEVDASKLASSLPHRSATL
jgi:RAT1-interacting protein